MRKTSIALITCIMTLLINFNLASASSPPFQGTDLETSMDRLIARQMEEYNIPNLTISIVASGEVIFAKGYGYANIEENTPVDPEKTLFRIGSSAKLLTWTAVMQLVEQGKLDLDVDVNEYLDFEIPNRLEYGANQEVGPITLRHLMAHTPGFEDRATGTFSLREKDLLPLAQYVRDLRPARIYPPGEVSAYSNYGASLAGYIVEVVSGLPFAQYIEQHIYQPLGMTNSTFRQPLPADLAVNMSTPYRFVNGEFRVAKFEYMSEPGGSMSSSALDMAQFMLAYLQGGQLDGQIILTEDTVGRMFGETFTLHPSLNGMAHGFIKTTFNGRDVFHHPGGTMLYDTGLYLLPDQEVGFFISHSGGSYLANIEIFQGFMEKYFPGEGVAAPSPPAGMAERSKAFVGEYHQNRRVLTNVDKFLSLLMGVIHVSADEEGYLMVSHLGETNKFVEIEPGVYYNLREGRSQDYGGDFRTIVFAEDPLGKMMLMSDGPMSYSRAAPHETFGLTFIKLFFSLAVMIVSLLYWGIKAIVLKLRRKAQTAENGKYAIWAKRVAVVQGLLAIAFVVGFASESEMDPVYGFPVSAFTQPSTLTQICDVVHSYAMVFLALLIVGFAILVWKKSYWRLATRIHYSLFALAGVILSWIFFFWKVI